ncbi:MAG: radical SAM protein [Candidatus Omnitrophota bacterium]
MKLPFLVFADCDGKIYSHPRLRMVASSAAVCLPSPSALIRLPEGSTRFYLPGRLPIGFDPVTKSFQVLESYRGRRTFAVGAFLIPAYLRLYHPAYQVVKPARLPLWAYAACGFWRGEFYVAAQRIDRRIRQSPRFYDNACIEKKVHRIVKQYPANRLYRHLAHCALHYNCLAAKNLFLGRWEAPLPTARACNARCIGCLSHQESDCVTSHERIGFKPSVREIEEVALPHLSGAREAIVSFGQGCEGEPLLEADTIAAAIRSIRKKTSRGTINMNTNASLPANVRLLCEAGIDSFRVSLNSPTQALYQRYCKPRGYAFGDVLRSIAIAKKYNKFVSINLFVFPGLTDSAREVRGLCSFIRNHGIDMIQWRNLNIDPDYYRSKVPKQYLARPRGVSALVTYVGRLFPRLKMGYFNLAKEQFSSFRNLTT